MDTYLVELMPKVIKELSRLPKSESQKIIDKDT